MVEAAPKRLVPVRGAEWLPRWVAGIRATVHTKLLVAFLSIVVMFVAMGAVGLQVLRDADQRAENLVNLHQKTTAFRQLQHNTTAQLYALTSTFLRIDKLTLAATMRRLNQFAYDFDHVLFVTTGDERELLEQIQADYSELIRVGTEVVGLLREGKLDEARELQRRRGTVLAKRLERQTNTLVNKAEADIAASANISKKAFFTSQQVVIGIALGSVALALILGYAISWSLIEAVKQMDVRFKDIAQGKFSGHLEVRNRDELGDLAQGLNDMAQEVGRLYREVEEASRHKSEFLANMSHELRTPLNAIIGFSQVLEERMFGELNEKQLEYVRDVHESGNHLLSLINDILDLSKIEAGLIELHPVEFDVGTALDHAQTLVKDRSARRSITLKVDVDDQLGEIVADQRKFKQILLNLLSNAIKFTNEGGQVSLTAKRNAESVSITVSDSGIGIAPEDQDTIFDEFQQVQSAQGGVTEGTGLGLTLTKKFVEMHGGEIWVESKPGEGSTFGFSIPYEPPGYATQSD